MKTTGNLTIAESIIIVLGILVGAAEKINPSEEKQIRIARETLESDVGELLEKLAEAGLIRA